MFIVTYRYRPPRFVPAGQGRARQRFETSLVVFEMRLASRARRDDTRKGVIVSHHGERVQSSGRRRQDDAGWPLRQGRR